MVGASIPPGRHSKTTRYLLEPKVNYIFVAKPTDKNQIHISNEKTPSLKSVC